MLTLRQLRYLDALARQRHFGRAAEECAVTQPALSMQIHELEEFLGGELVERCHGDAILTELGKQIAERAASILRDAHDLVDFAHHNGRLLTGILRLGVIPTLAPYLLPRVLPELQRRYPDLRPSLLEAQTKTLLNELTRGNVDLLLLSLPVEKADVETLKLFEDRFLLAVPASDSLPEGARVTPDDVRARNLILLGEGHCLREQALTFCPGALNDANTNFFATSLATITQMVATGYGATLLPEVAVDVEVRDDRIKLLRFREPQPRRSVGLMWRRTSPCRADFVAFGQIVIKAAPPPRSLTKDYTAPLRVSDARN
jgi:LysR family transcriptional regulator, hydrogen peroxide-inducible genes activator